MAEPVFERNQTRSEEPGGRDQAAIDGMSSQQPQTMAVITGAGRGFGSAIPGAPIDLSLLLTGRTPDNANTVARQASSAGGAVESALVDALHQKSVTEHLDVAVPDPAGIDLCACEITGHGFHAHA